MIPGQPAGSFDADLSVPPAEGDASLEVGEESDGFRLRMSKDRMRVTLDCDATGRDLDGLARAVLERLVRFHLHKQPAPERIQEIIREGVASSPILEELELLKGTPPVFPIDGQINWTADFFNPGFEVDEATGRINFRHRIGNRNVAAGMLLATVTAPVKGINGLDLMGNLVRVRKPRSCRIRAGENVETAEDGLGYFAATAGRIRWQGDLLSVDQVFEIEGDVGLGTGDISHDGAVFVHGDVLQGSRLQAVGDVEVTGTVEGAHVQTGGVLHVHGGITGNEHTRIVAAGGVRARFIMEAHILSSGDITVENEIVHSAISTRGAVFVPTGRIVGGEINALGGVDAGQIGSHAAVPTQVTAGEDHSLEGQLVILRNKLRLATENVEKVHNTLAPLRGKIAHLPEKSREALRTLLGNLPGMEARVEELKEAIAEVHAESESRSRPVVLIRNHLYSESRLRVRGETLHVRESVEGPVRPIVVDGRVRLAATHMQHIAQPLDPTTGFLLHRETH